jgi:hypothetical protein
MIVEEKFFVPRYSWGRAAFTQVAIAASSMRDQPANDRVELVNVYGLGEVLVETGFRRSPAVFALAADQRLSPGGPSGNSFR